MNRGYRIRIDGVGLTYGILIEMDPRLRGDDSSRG